MTMSRPLVIPTQMLGCGPTPVFTNDRSTRSWLHHLATGGIRDDLSRALERTSILQLIADRFRSGPYSVAVHERQAALAPLSQALTRTEPRQDIPVPLAAPPASDHRTDRVACARRQRGRIPPGCNKNSRADDAGIAVGWPAAAAPA